MTNHFLGKCTCGKFKTAVGIAMTVYDMSELIRGTLNI